MSVPRVALIIEGSSAYGNGLLQGIADFLQVNGQWSVYLPEAARGEEAAAVCRNWRGEGIIVRAESAATAAAMAKCTCPVVNLSATTLLPSVPTVHSDQRVEAELAFAHLWERGFRNLAFCGATDYLWAEWQLKRFSECALAAGSEVHAHMAPMHLRQPRDWAIGRHRLVKWLRQIPKPIGILACNDLLGQEVVDVCHEAGIRVPDEVAVVGVDDDPIRCGLSDPPLSSISPDTRRVGHLAAELLARMMAGEKVDVGPRYVSPLGVVARRSTDALAVHDPEIAQALQYIRSHACEPISVKSLLNVIPLSRRALESRFVKVLGRSPHEQILHCRVERAKQLLHDTDLPIKSIANLVGTGTPEYLSVLFRRLIGSSPSEYRDTHKTIAARGERTSSPVCASASPHRIPV